MTDDLFDFKPIIAGSVEHVQRLDKMHLLKNDSPIRMATISKEGKA